MRSAQKLAQDSYAALEIYQRQVRRREEQFAHSDSLYVASSRALCTLFDARLYKKSLTSLWSRSARLNR